MFTVLETFDIKVSILVVVENAKLNKVFLGAKINSLANGQEKRGSIGLI